LERARETQWTYGPVSCHIYPLEEIDTLRAEGGDTAKEKREEPEAPSALEIIIQNKHLEILSSSRILGLLDLKWKAYAGRAFLVRCWGTFLYVIVLTCAVICRSPYFHYDFSDSQDIGRVITVVIVVIGWFYKGAKEGRELWSSGLSYFKQQGSAFLENSLSFAFLVSLPIAVICQAANNTVQDLDQPNNPATFFTFICVLSAWTYVLTLLLGFQLTGVFVIMLWKMFITDVARFASIYIMVLLGQSIAFYAIEDPTQTAQYVYPGPELGSNLTWFKEYWWRLENTFLVLLGQISFDYVESVSLPEYVWLSDLLLLFHVVFSPTIM